MLQTPKVLAIAAKPRYRLAPNVGHGYVACNMKSVELHSSTNPSSVNKQKKISENVKNT